MREAVATRSWSKWRLRQCPRCGGDLNLNVLYREWSCLQCGKVVEELTPRVFAGIESTCKSNYN